MITAAARATTAGNEHRACQANTETLNTHSALRETQTSQRSINQPQANTVQQGMPMRLASNPSMSWQKAGAVTGKHALYFASGSLPFAMAFGAKALSNLHHFSSGFVEHMGQEHYSAVSDLIDTTTDTIKAGIALTTLAALLAYPMGRFIFAPAVQKSYETLMPEDMKEVVNFAVSEMPTVVKSGAEAISDLGQSCLKTLKQVPETAPATLTQMGMGLGGLTQRGADAVTRVAKESMDADARYQRAVQKNTVAEIEPEKTVSSSQTQEQPTPSQRSTPKAKRLFLATRFLNKNRKNNRASI